MNKFTKNMIADYFTPEELVEILDISTDELIEAIEDFDEAYFSDEKLNQLEEIMGVADETLSDRFSEE